MVRIQLKLNLNFCRMLNDLISAKNIFMFLSQMPPQGEP